MKLALLMACHNKNNWPARLIHVAVAVTQAIINDIGVRRCSDLGGATTVTKINDFIVMLVDTNL